MAVIVPLGRLAGRVWRARWSMPAARLGRKLARDARGGVALEYGLIVALVVIAVLASLVEFGGANLDIWTNVTAKVTAATN